MSEFRFLRPSSEVHKCRILDNMIPRTGEILLLNNTRLRLQYRVVETSVEALEGGGMRVDALRLCFSTKFSITASA